MYIALLGSWRLVPASGLQNNEICARKGEKDWINGGALTDLAALKHGSQPMRAGLGIILSITVYMFLLSGAVAQRVELGT
jgi:hypothetical protein